MSDQQPRYGEYATPEEQRLRAGLPPVEAAPAAPAPSPAPAPTPTARPGAADRIVTIALLAYGLVNVVMTAIAYLDLPTVLEQSMSILGIEGEFTNFAQGRLWGGIAALVLVLGYALTVLVAFRRLRARKRSWWVPIVGAVATMIVVTVCIMVPMLSDPAFVQYLRPGGV
ncbi:DUF6264 family protein [Microbacterium sp. CIAB417]|uniref:DUF6264 family protein n=1 Tax=Microbacterium sp. CIAB417 TaxID=2860287 RepID=UPI001FAC9777|nr:DUF6264 family protein [Microbacterium sp. CIAB417]